jgi:hypothetical protein
MIDSQASRLHFFLRRGSICGRGRAFLLHALIPACVKRLWPSSGYWVGCLFGQVLWACCLLRRPMLLLKRQHVATGTAESAFNDVGNGMVYGQVYGRVYGRLTASSVHHWRVVLVE